MGKRGWRGFSFKKQRNTDRKCDDKQILRGTIIIIIFAVIVAVVMGRSYLSSREGARRSVEQQLLSRARVYAEKIQSEMGYAAEVGKAVSQLAQDESVWSRGEMQEVLRALCGNTRIYAAAVIKQNGVAYNQDGKSLQQSDLPYMEIVQQQKYIYVEDDGMTGRSALVVMVPVTAGNDTIKGNVYLYYPVEKIAEVFNTAEYEEACFYALIDDDDNTLVSAGDESVFTQGKNLGEMLRESDLGNKGYERLRQRMNIGSEAVVDVVCRGEERSIAYTSLGNEKWQIIIGIDTAHLEGVQNERWKSTRKLVGNLTVLWILFFIAAFIVSHFMRNNYSEQQKELVDKASTDLLTDLTNKMATEKLIREYIAAHPNEQCLMLVIDVDNFKKVNDTMGHALGDEILKNLAMRLRGTFRISDIVGRIGGDEFVVFLKNLKSDVLIQQEAERLMRVMDEITAGEYVKYRATVSAGAAVYPRDAQSYEELFRAADTALYRAKKKGKHQLAYYQAGDLGANEEIKAADS